MIAGCVRRGLVVLGTLHGNVLRLLPPLVISEELLAEALDIWPTRSRRRSASRTRPAPPGESVREPGTAHEAGGQSQREVSDRLLTGQERGVVQPRPGAGRRWTGPRCRRTSSGSGRSGSSGRSRRPRRSRNGSCATGSPRWPSSGSTNCTSRRSLLSTGSPTISVTSAWAPRAAAGARPTCGSRRGGGCGRSRASCGSRHAASRSQG